MKVHKIVAPKKKEARKNLSADSTFCVIFNHQVPSGEIMLIASRYLRHCISSATVLLALLACDAWSGSAPQHCKG
jgi:hypothetical protein